ncbi:MAG: ABC transporter ATP-binding protein [Candidatus Ozemobacteraceae bacterium]
MNTTQTSFPLPAVESKPIIPLLVSDLKKSFGRRTVLDKISFHIERGQVVGLLGRNGAGKSTLFHIMHGLLAPDAGRVEICGIDPFLDPTAARCKVGWVSEECHFPIWMTCADLEYFLKPFFPSWDSPTLATLVKDLDIPVDQPNGEMSKGSRRKLMLVLALAPKPDVLLLDEPLAGLDLVVRDQILSTLIKTMAEAGQTILLSSHEITLLEGVCDRLLLLSGKHLAIDDSIESLKKRVRRVVATLAAPVTALPSHPDILSAHGHGCELDLVVRAGDDQSALALLANLQVRESRVSGLSLPEIFTHLTAGKEA